MANTVYNPNTSNVSDGSVPANDLVGKQGEKIVADLHGKWYNAANRKNVFKFSAAAAVTVPVGSASNLVSVFTLYNPASSGVMGEIITTELGHSNATTVVNVIAWYFSPAALSALGTFTTPGVANTNYFSARVGENPAGQIVPYSAYTHSGTPVRVDMVATFGAVTDATVWNAAVKTHDGALLLPPGVAISLGTSTATETNCHVGVTWAEWPFSS